MTWSASLSKYHTSVIEFDKNGNGLAIVEALDGSGMLTMIEDITFPSQDKKHSCHRFQFAHC